MRMLHNCINQKKKGGQLLPRQSFWMLARDSFARGKLSHYTWILLQHMTRYADWVLVLRMYGMGAIPLSDGHSNKQTVQEL